MAARLTLRKFYRLMASIPNCLPSVADVAWYATEAGYDHEGLASAIVRAEARGMAETWQDGHHGACVCLTALAASLLGLKASSVSRRGKEWDEPRWVKKRKRDHNPKARGQFFQLPQQENEWALEAILGPEDPDAQVYRRPLDADNPPAVRLVLGIGLPWPRPGMATVGNPHPHPPYRCESCGAVRSPRVHNPPLGDDACCVECDRSGFDRYFDAYWAVHRRPGGRRQYHPSDRLKGGVGA